MKYTISKSEIKGKIKAPASKSYTHRAIVIASLITKATINPCRDFLANN